MTLADLDALIRAVCPIDGCNTNGVIFFKATATAAQKSSAQAIMAQNLPNVVV